MQQVENFPKKEESITTRHIRNLWSKILIMNLIACLFPVLSFLVKLKSSFGSCDWASCCKPIWPRIQKIGIIFTLSLTKGHMQVKPKRKPEAKIRPKQLQRNGRSRNHQNPEGSKIQYHLARQKFQSINYASINVMHLCFIWQG